MRGMSSLWNEKERWWGWWWRDRPEERFVWENDLHFAYRRTNKIVAKRLSARDRYGWRELCANGVITKTAKSSHEHFYRRQTHLTLLFIFGKVSRADFINIKSCFHWQSQRDFFPFRLKTLNCRRLTHSNTSRVWCELFFRFDWIQLDSNQCNSSQLHILTSSMMFSVALRLVFATINATQAIYGNNQTKRQLVFYLAKKKSFLFEFNAQVHALMSATTKYCSERNAKF